MSDQNGIYITKKQASISVAVLLLVGLLIFIVGYFWGKQSLIDGFSEKTSQESFNDQVDYLLTMQSFAAKHGPLQDDKKEDEASNETTLLKSIPDAIEETEKDTVALKKNNSLSVQVKEPAKEKVNIDCELKKDAVADKVDNGALHYAAIAGFGKKQSAVAMVSRLKKHGIDAQLKVKMSKSGSGKSGRTWFQVTTTPQTMPNLTAIVDRVVCLEHVKRNDIKII
jgi:hypothetical protein